MTVNKQMVLPELLYKSNIILEVVLTAARLWSSAVLGLDYYRHDGTPSHATLFKWLTSQEKDITAGKGGYDCDMLKDTAPHCEGWHNQHRMTTGVNQRSVLQDFWTHPCIPSSEKMENSNDLMVEELCLLNNDIWPGTGSISCFRKQTNNHFRVISRCLTMCFSVGTWKDTTKHSVSFTSFKTSVYCIFGWIS